MNLHSGNSSSITRSRVLIVEDDGLIALLIEEFVRDLGYECLGPFTSLATALPVAHDDHFDAAVLNLVLGGAWTYQLAEVLERRGIPFGFASGVPRSGLEARWRHVPYIAKPFIADDVRRLLLELLPPIALEAERSLS